MKKFKDVIIFALCAIVLMSCGKFQGTNQSIWSEGMWIIPLVLFLFGSFFMWKAYKASKSGSNINIKLGGGEGGKVPMWKTGWFVLSAIFYAGMLGVIIWQNIEK